MRVFVINRRVVEDQELYIRAESYADALWIAKARSEPRSTDDLDLAAAAKMDTSDPKRVRVTYRSLGTGHPSPPDSSND